VVIGVRPAHVRGGDHDVCSPRRRTRTAVALGGEYEAGLAIGLQRVDAAMLVIQPSARDALAPGLDQTRTVGLVTLPGAFVGVLLGGGTPVQAGAAQILVLVGLMAVQATTAAVLLRLMAQGRVVREDLQGAYPR
jgi:putative ABC transport system permease protein